MWRNDHRFDAENFGNQPTYTILQAIEQGYKLQAESKHLDELGIATLTACFVNANRDPKKSSPAKPQDFFFFDTGNNKYDVHPEAVEIFFALAKSKKLPLFALNIVDIYKMKELRTHEEPNFMDVLLHPDFILIQPTIQSGKMKVRLAFIGKPEIRGQLVTMTDFDGVPKCEMKVPVYLDAYAAISDLTILEKVRWLTPQ